MPILTKAEEDQVLLVDPERDQSNSGDLRGTELSATLAQHGVKCIISQASAINTDVSGELLRQADAFGPDLLGGVRTFPVSRVPAGRCFTRYAAKYEPACADVSLISQMGRSQLD